ncbi:hypothetical protein FVE85_8489 [Porphyridium purpureum]|uniref:Transmembrane protein n=1 Tax=Porphyridium purpureum TaxID=35688 RepID=A0A5J4YNM7_PORPP|nr:hypothetical protein FVE85_8489 [Porphyridium purpureum]|eukprot:POR7613..scf244_11
MTSCSSRQSSRRFSLALVVRVLGVVLVLVAAAHPKQVQASGIHVASILDVSVEDLKNAYKPRKFHGRRLVGVVPYDGELLSRSLTDSMSKETEIVSENFQNVKSRLHLSGNTRMPTKPERVKSELQLDYEARLVNEQSPATSVAEHLAATQHIITDYMVRLVRPATPSVDLSRGAAHSQEARETYARNRQVLADDYASKLESIAQSHSSITDDAMDTKIESLADESTQQVTRSNAQEAAAISAAMHGTTGTHLKRRLIMTNLDPNEKAITYARSVNPDPVRTASHKTFKETLASSKKSPQTFRQTLASAKDSHVVHAMKSVNGDKKPVLLTADTFSNGRKMVNSRAVGFPRKDAVILVGSMSWHSSVEAALRHNRWLMALAGLMVFIVGLLVPALMVLPFKQRYMAAVTKARAQMDAEALRENCMEMGMEEHEYVQLLSEHLRSEPSGSVLMEERSSHGAEKPWPSFDVMSFITRSTSSSRAAASPGTKLADRFFEKLVAMSHVTRSKTSAPVVDVEAGGHVGVGDIAERYGRTHVKIQQKHASIPIIKMFSSPAVYDSSRMFESREKVLGVAVGDELV